MRAVSEIFCDFFRVCGGARTSLVSCEAGCPPLESRVVSSMVPVMGMAPATATMVASHPHAVTTLVLMLDRVLESVHPRGLLGGNGHLPPKHPDPTRQGNEVWPFCSVPRRTFHALFMFRNVRHNSMHRRVALIKVNSNLWQTYKRCYIKQSSMRGARSLITTRIMRKKPPSKLPREADLRASHESELDNTHTHVHTRSVRGRLLEPLKS